MQQHGIKARGKRKFIATTDSNHGLPVAENLLNREFQPAAPNAVWTSDITYIATDEGWLYLAVVIDLFSRQIVGWSVQPHMRRELVMDALRMAWFRRQPGKEANVIFHSDRGSQHCSGDFQDLLTSYGMRSSMSRKGNCWNNAPTESLWGSLKVGPPVRAQVRDHAGRQGRDHRLDGVLQPSAPSLNAGLRQSDAIRTGLARCPGKASRVTPPVKGCGSQGQGHSCAASLLLFRPPECLCGR